MMGARLLSPALILVAAAAPLDGQQTKGTIGIEAARRGGVIIACRHGITPSVDENEMTLVYDDPSTQRRLSRRGERQAAAIGRAFRVLEIPVAEVIASPMQRARLTAELAFPNARIVLDSTWHTRGDDYSGPKKDRRLEVLGTPVERGNRVIISHIGTMYSVLPSIRGELDEGDCAVVRPRGEREFVVVEVVPWRAWLRATHLDDVDQS